MVLSDERRADGWVGLQVPVKNRDAGIDLDRFHRLEHINGYEVLPSLKVT